MKKILSCDGGGIRGKATTQFLFRVEKELEKHGTSIKECVDFFAGTSTGAIIACALATTDLTMAEINELYNPESAKVIFAENVGLFEVDGINAPKYEASGKTKKLIESFRAATIGDVPDGKHVMVTAYDVESRRPLIIKSTKDEHRSVLSWQAADASSAAPTFFPTVETPIADGKQWLIDGGVNCNNPTMCAVAESLKLWWMDFKVLSVGTGTKTKPIDGPESAEWGVLGWFAEGDIIGLLSDESVVNYQAKTIMGADKYIRVNSEMSQQPGLEFPPSDKMDDISPENIKKLSDMGDFWFDQYGQEVVEFLLS